MGTLNGEKYFFTEHAKIKMRQYGLSAQRVKRVIRSPYRSEEGIAEKTIAVMQPVSEKTVNGKKVWKQEIWVMYRLCDSKAIPNNQFSISNKNLITKVQKLKTIDQKLKIISAWRYPGVSPKNNPIPEEILREIEKVI